jgi:hypothetical protein
VCASDETCGADGTCGADVVDVTTLPTYTAPRTVDGGVRDAGGSDGGPDADGGPDTDTGVPEDGGPDAADAMVGCGEACAAGGCGEGILDCSGARPICTSVTRSSDDECGPGGTCTTTGACRVLVLPQPRPDAFRPGDDFGPSIAVSGSLVVVGSPYATSEDLIQGGRVDVFDTSTERWTRLFAPGAPTNGDEFGLQVAVDHDAVGGPRVVASHTNGLYVFRLSGDDWLLEGGKLVSDSAGVPDFAAVEIDFPLLVAAGNDAARENRPRLSTFSFGTEWVGTDHFDIGADTDNGADLDLHRDDLIAGGSLVDATVWRRDGTAWTSMGRIAEPSPGERFGAAVARFGSLIVVGAPAGMTDGLIFGNVYVGTERLSVLPHDAIEGGTRDSYGEHVAAASPTRFVTAANLSAQVAYVFEQDAFGSWWESYRLQPVTAAPSGFGDRLDADGSLTAIWADSDGGQLYLFDDAVE